MRRGIKSHFSPPLLLCGAEAAFEPVTFSWLEGGEGERRKMEEE